MRERLIKLSSKIMVLLLAFVMVFGFDSGVSFATPQEDLDKGYVVMTSNGNIKLSEGETYYIAVKGGSGTSGGSAERKYYDGSISYNYGSSGGQGAISYYKIDVKEDTILNLYIGSGMSNSSGLVAGPVVVELMVPLPGGLEGEAMVAGQQSLHLLTV